MSEYIGNGSQRKAILKKLILDLHAGGDLAEIKSRFRALVGSVSAIEIAQMEQELISEGLPTEEVKALCDVHVAVFQEGLQGEASPEMTPGHPIHTFKYENFAAGEVLKLLTDAIAALPDADAWERVRVHVEQLAEIDRIYLRKENLLFPFLEKHGVTGPSSVMWNSQNDIRAQLKSLRQAVQAGDAGQVTAVFGPLGEAIKQMFYKEEHILYPTALKMLTEPEWVAIRDQSDEIGYCLIRPGDAWRPEASAAAALPAAQPYEEAPVPLSSELWFDTGSLTLEQANLLLTHLPVDVTFVDENDTVRYFSQGRQERIFVRTASIIGRKVQNCHPQASVHVVNRILDDFRQGRRDMAEFWIPLGAKFVHIRYFALRDPQGQYRGTIEVTQDLAPLRKLEGERRLLADQT